MMTRLSMSSFVLVACCTAAPALAMGQFYENESQDVVYCANNNLTGRYGPASNQYQAAGTCAAYQTPGRDMQTGQSTFPDPTHAPLLFQAAWTAQGSFNPTTHEVQEVITLPAPTVDQPAPASRPYGRFSSSMICVTDPWLDQTSTCTGIKVSAQGSLGLLDSQLRRVSRPLSSSLQIAQRQALVDQHNQRMAGLTAAYGVTSKAVGAIVGLKPTIIAPAAGGTARLGKPFYVRIAPSAGKATMYYLELQRMDTGGGWAPAGSMTLSGPATESATGVALWGAANAMMTAGEPQGSYRLRASADGGAASDWRPFTVVGIAEVNALPSNAWQTGSSDAGVSSLQSKMTPVSPLSRGTAIAPPQPTPRWNTAPSAIGH